MIELAAADTGEPASERGYTPPPSQIVRASFDAPRPGVASVRIPDPGSPAVDLEDETLTGGAGDSPEIDGLDVQIRELRLELEVQSKHIVGILAVLRAMSPHVQETHGRMTSFTEEIATWRREALSEALTTAREVRLAEFQLAQERQQAAIERRAKWEDFVRRHAVGFFAATTAIISYMLGDTSLGAWAKDIASFFRGDP